MAKSKTKLLVRKKVVVKKRISIVNSRRSKPKNKHLKENWKKYRGQGK